ncbi:MAG: hypothetical protein ACI965_000033 [Paraglaciecola sp.]
MNLLIARIDSVKIPTFAQRPIIRTAKVWFSKVRYLF